MRRSDVQLGVVESRVVKRKDRIRNLVLGKFKMPKKPLD